MFVAPCCFFAPCKEEECSNIIQCKEECCNCCICCISYIALWLYITNTFIYFIGLVFYSLFWIIGKLFVSISCCDCWLKEDYDMDSFRFTRASNTELVDSESKEVEKEVKKNIDKLITKKEQKEIKKISNNIIKRFQKTLKGSNKKSEKD